jgi:cytochrome b6-f complex iron-sulfur subunit
MPDMDRRTFLATAAAACACAACPLAAIAAGESKEPPDPVEVGTAADFARDGAYDTYAASHGFFLVLKNGKLYAPRATCTHKDTLLKMKGSAFACPKHGARFDLQGVVTKAPAKKPLSRYGITANASGQITVDPSRTFDQDHWDDEASFVALP